MSEARKALAKLSEYDRARGDMRLLHALRGVEGDALREALHSMQEARFRLQADVKFLSRSELRARMTEAVAVLEQGIDQARDALDITDPLEKL